MCLDTMLIQANLPLTDLINKGVLIIEPIWFSVKNNGEFLIYQTIGISLVHKSKYLIDYFQLRKSIVQTALKGRAFPIFVGTSVLETMVSPIIAPLGCKIYLF